MRIIIDYEASWRNSFLDGDNNLPIPEQGRKYIGSGSGRLLGPLVAAGKDVLGLECSSEMAKLSRENFPDAKVLDCLLYTSPSPRDGT